MLVQELGKDELMSFLSGQLFQGFGEHNRSCCLLELTFHCLLQDPAPTTGEISGSQTSILDKILERPQRKEHLVKKRETAIVKRGSRMVFCKE